MKWMMALVFAGVLAFTGVAYAGETVLAEKVYQTSVLQKTEVFLFLMAIAFLVIVFI